MNKLNFKVIILLGSNLGNRNKYLEKATYLINDSIGKVIFETIIIDTEPIDFTADQSFLNQILVVETTKSPIQCLDLAKQIEKNLGRIYIQPKENEKYCSRFIDIDLLNYNDINFKSISLELPHSQIFTRNFVKELLNKVPSNVKTCILSI